MIQSCPRCNRNKGETPPVGYVGGMTTCLGFIPRQDVDGHWHHHDGNETSGEFTCANGCSGRFSDMPKMFVMEFDGDGVTKTSDYALRFLGDRFELPPLPRCWCGWSAVEPDIEYPKSRTPFMVKEVPGIVLVNAAAVKKVQSSA